MPERAIYGPMRRSSGERPRDHLSNARESIGRTPARSVGERPRDHWPHGRETIGCFRAALRLEGARTDVRPPPRKPGEHHVVRGDLFRLWCAARARRHSAWHGGHFHFPKPGGWFEQRRWLIGIGNFHRLQFPAIARFIVCREQPDAIIGQANLSLPRVVAGLIGRAANSGDRIGANFS